MNVIASLSLSYKQCKDPMVESLILTLMEIYLSTTKDT